jgi:hypothetical protein
VASAPPLPVGEAGVRSVNSLSPKRLDWFAAQPFLHGTICRMLLPMACGNLSCRTKNVVVSQRVVTCENLLARMSLDYGLKNAA